MRLIPTKTNHINYHYLVIDHTRMNVSIRSSIIVLLIFGIATSVITTLQKEQSLASSLCQPLSSEFHTCLHERVGCGVQYDASINLLASRNSQRQALVVPPRPLIMRWDSHIVAK
jgi:hypothetical protein